MNKGELIQVLTFLHASYRELFKYPLGDKTVDETTEEVWYGSLKSYTYKETLAAITVIKLEGDKYPPHDGMIARKIMDNQEGESMTADEAWDRTMALCQARESICISKYPPGTTEVAKLKMKEDTVLQNEPSEIVKTIRSLGGLTQIGDNYTDTYSRTQFNRTYNSIKETIQARNIKQVAGVEDITQIEEKQVSTKVITEGLKKVGNK